MGSKNFVPISQSDTLLGNLKLSDFPINYADLVPQNIRDMERKNREFIDSIPTPQERFKFMTDKIDEQTKELHSIQYTNMKLTAQKEEQLKIIDSQNEKLDTLQNINNELKVANSTIKEQGKHSFRNGIIIGLAPLAIEWVIRIIIHLYQYLR